MRQGTVHQISVSNGGVPKLAMASAAVGRLGVAGDRQNDTKHHGGPERAVCLFSLEVIEKLRAEGHPITPGSAGENVTVAGIDWKAVSLGSRFEFEGGVVLEVASYTNPCSAIRDSFEGLNFKRIKQDVCPGDSRVYARVLTEGLLSTGEGVVLLPARIGMEGATAMMSGERARSFATAWYAAWNAHNVDAIMDLYSDGIRHSSPFIARYNGDQACRPLEGKAAVREYFARALERNPTLRFDPMHIGVGVETVNLVYRRMSGDLAVEVFYFDAAGKVLRSVSHYEERQ